MSTPPLHYLYVNPSSACNLRCSHCWISRGGKAGGFHCRDREPGELSPDQLRDILEQAMPLGLRMVKFTGGEPLLRADFPSLYQAAADLSGGSVGITVETNGTVVPEGLWSVMERRKPDLVSVSLDSADPDEHDSFRKSCGAWKRTVDFTGELTRRSIPVQIIMSIAVPDTEAVLEMASLSSRLGVSGLKINPVQPVGRGASLPRTGAAALIEFAGEIHRKFGPSVKVDIPPALLPIGRIRSSGRCPVLNLLGLLPDGRISLCGIGLTHDELIMGSALSTALAEIWRGSPLLAELRKTVPESIGGICSNCIHRNTCRGKCVVQNYHLSGCLTSSFWICEEAERIGLFPSSRKIDSGA